MRIPHAGVRGAGAGVRIPTLASSCHVTATASNLRGLFVRLLSITCPGDVALRSVRRPDAVRHQLALIPRTSIRVALQSEVLAQSKTLARPRASLCAILA